MSAIILDGRKTREDLVPKLINRVKALSFVPALTIIQVGDRADSASFIRAKKAFADKIGVKVELLTLAENVSESEVIDRVKKLNTDENVQGIIVQLPLPTGINADSIIESIDPRKDVDALTSSHNGIYPATARGIRTLLREYKIDLSGKKVTVIGRSNLVGKPIIAMCKNENATVTVCHSKTPKDELLQATQNADIIIVAAGVPNLITSDMVKERQVIVDVGINGAGEQLVGDVDFKTVFSKVAAITPVPGGVGPMTVFSLFENLLDLCENINN